MDATNPTARRMSPPQTPPRPSPSRIPPSRMRRRSRRLGEMSPPPYGSAAGSPTPPTPVEGHLEIETAAEGDPPEHWYYKRRPDQSRKRLIWGPPAARCIPTYRNEAARDITRQEFDSREIAPASVRAGVALHPAVVAPAIGMRRAGPRGRWANFRRAR